MTKRARVPRAASKLERLFALALLAFGRELPAAEREYRFHPSRRWRFDWAWPHPAGLGGVAVEVDGGQWQAHGGRHNTDGDREKLNEAARLGWRVLRFSGTMLADSASCIAQVRAALAQAGVMEGSDGA